MPTRSIEAVCKWCALGATRPSWRVYEEATSCDTDGALCPVCLGILQKVASHIETAREALGRCGPVNSIRFSLSLPVAVTIREKAASWLVEAQGHSIKEALKALLENASICPVTTSVNDNSVVCGEIQVHLKFEATEADIEKLPSRLIQDNKPDKHQRKKKRGNNQISVSSVVDTLDQLRSEEQLELIEKLFFSSSARAEPVSLTVSCVRDSAFLVGRYRKLSRVMPQSRWIIDGKRKGVSSVEEVLESAVKEQFAEIGAVKFLASGREDHNVRMLGTGRPFALELIDPKILSVPNFSLVVLAAAVERISTDLAAPVQAHDLRFTDKSGLKEVDAGAETKAKSYTCVVWFQRALSATDVEVLNSTKNLIIEQSTPVRVMHSRSLLLRSRTVHSLHLELHNPHFGSLTLCTAAGTYIKEFVHGDFGRTTPSLGSLLGTKADILQLDVLDIAIQ